MYLLMEVALMVKLDFYMDFLSNSGHSSGYDGRSVRAFSYGSGE